MFKGSSHNSALTSNKPFYNVGFLLWAVEICLVKPHPDGDSCMFYGRAQPCNGEGRGSSRLRFPPNCVPFST